MLLLRLTALLRLHGNNNLFFQNTFYKLIAYTAGGVASGGLKAASRFGRAPEPPELSQGPLFILQRSIPWILTCFLTFI